MTVPLSEVKMPENRGTEYCFAPPGAVGEHVAEPCEANAAQHGEDGSTGED